MRIQPDVRPILHRLGEQERSQPSGERRRNSFIEEDPHVAASPGTRPLEDRRNVEPPASREEREDILLPAGFVEVDREKVTRLIQQQRIHTRDERLAGVVLSP